MLAERIEQPRAYTMEQSARLLNLSARKMDELVALKLIRSFKVGKSRRISADALAFRKEEVESHFLLPTAFQT
jgi:excisionase family DNA binding protein